MEITNVLFFLPQLVSKPDKMMPFFVQDIMGHLAGMPGVFISCVFSAVFTVIEHASEGGRFNFE